jgi:SAM-dependent methyltransferase
LSEATSVTAISYACPKCKHTLYPTENALQCVACNQTYPIVDSIPDFLAGGSGADLAPILRIARGMDILAPIYENRLWYQALLNLAGAGRNSLHSIAKFHTEALKEITGAVLDVACGPATYGRRIASPSRNVYGLDISMGALRQGLNYVRQEGIVGIHLARARVEALPFENEVFDGGICSGSLHLFPDTVFALREIARTMKAGAPLSVQTFVAGGQTAVMRLLSKWRDVKAFELSQLQQALAEAGFEKFQPKQEGVFLTFSVRKPAPHA